MLDLPGVCFRVFHHSDCSKQILTDSQHYSEGISSRGAFAPPGAHTVDRTFREAGGFSRIESIVER